MAINPQFAVTPRATMSRLSGSDASRDGATLVSSSVSFTAGASGSRLDFLTFTAAGVTGSASAARVCRAFLTDTSGLNPRLISEVALTAVTPAVSTIGSTSTITFTNGLVIGSGQLVRTSMSAGSATDIVDVLARGGDF